VLSGTHAAPGRQVSTWVHAVKTDESAVLGVVLSFCHPRLSSRGCPSEPVFGLCTDLFVLFSGPHTMNLVKVGL
jgi:hypothetical protein